MFRQLTSLMRPGPGALPARWWAIVCRKGWKHDQGLRRFALTETVQLADAGALRAFAEAPFDVALRKHSP